MFAYSLRMVVPVCSKLGVLMPWEKEEIFRKSKDQKIILSFSAGEGGFCSSETKHDTVMVPRQKLFISVRWTVFCGLNKLIGLLVTVHHCQTNSFVLPVRNDVVGKMLYYSLVLLYCTECETAVQGSILRLASFPKMWYQDKEIWLSLLFFKVGCN